MAFRLIYNWLPVVKCMGYCTLCGLLYGIWVVVWYLGC